MAAPLADRIRPQTLDDVVGQEHLLAPGMVLRRMVETGSIPNLIFYGPSGVGKTTVASIIAKKAGKKLVRLNGTTASTQDIRDAVAARDTIDGLGGVLLYLDEIQYLNKKQQQSLLECIEDGSVTLIASTTENPYFYVYGAVLSRSTVFEFKPVTPADTARAVRRAFEAAGEDGGYVLAEGVVEYIAQACGGDVRKAVNAVELLALAAGGRREITLEDAKQVAQKSAMRYDREGDEHYDLLSALQKSIRGSDENAALHYLARLLEAGDLLSPCRRLLVIASEDIGLAYPMAIAVAKACVDAAVQIGLPEAQIPLAEAVVLLAHRAQVERLLHGDRGGDGRRARREVRPAAPLPPEQALRRRGRQESRPVLPLSARLSQPLPAPAVPARRPARPGLLPVRGQQDGTGGQSLP